MLTEFNHLNHSSVWMVPSLSCRNTVTCITCLLDVLNDTNLSQVQKQMSLDMLKSLVQESDVTLQLLTTNQDMCCHILHLVTDFYTNEPYRQTSISLCVALINRLEDEAIYEILIDKFQRAVLDMSSDKRIQFFLLVLSQLSQLSILYTRILVCSQTETFSHLLTAQEMMEVDTVSCLACLLLYIIKALPTSPEQFLEETDSFLWKIMVTLVFWLNTAVNKSFQANCLALLKECLQHEQIISGLLLVGQSNLHGHSLFMGLKRMMVTKDDMLEFVATQCLTRVMDNLEEGREHVKQIFDTDLTQFVFEQLHTSDVSRLDCVFKCLHSMARHQLFFDKCHAVYGLDSCLLAIQEALDNGRSAILELGLSFLTCLMKQQPECMPLFVSLSWSKCCQLLNSCLQHRKFSLFISTLKATQVFLRVQHQQSHVDVASVMTLLKTVSSQCENHLRIQSDQNQDQQSVSIIDIILDIALANFDLAVSDGVLCGNLEEHIKGLKTVVRDVCGKLILPWMLEHWDYLSDSSRIEKLLACLDVHMSTDGQDQKVQLAHVMATGLPCRIISLSLQSVISEDTKRLMGHILAGLFLQFAKYMRPPLELHEEILVTGFSRLTWQDVQSGRCAAERINSKEEVVACFCLIYISWLMGYRIWTLMDIHTFLEIILTRFQDLLSYQVVVARAFVYLQAICQTCDNDEDNVWHDEIEYSLMDHLQKSPVQEWLTEDPVVFRWSVLTETRTNTIGIMLMEHLMLELAILPHPHGLDITLLTEDKRAILLGMRHNENFLHCMVVLLNSQAVAHVARDVLVYCISSLPDGNIDSHHVALCENLFTEVNLKFGIWFVQSAELNVHLVTNMLPVLCVLIESPILSTYRQISSVKSVYHAVKLVGMSAVSGDALAWTLKYLSCVTGSMSVPDSRTVIPPMITDVNFMDRVENCMTNIETRLSTPALYLCAWLAATQHQYQVHRVITVTSDFLLSSLASCKYANSLPVLKLLNSALSTMCPAASTLPRSVQFVKRQQNFVSPRVFSARQLKQVYLYLQQFVVKEDVNLRTETVECLKTFFTIPLEICQQAHLQSWNSLMLESVLTARTHSGLTDAELDLGLLFLVNMDKVWVDDAANSFLLALLKSDLNISQLDKANTIIKQIKLVPGIVDQQLLAAVEDHWSKQTATAI